MQRKVFRIEAMMAGKPLAANASADHRRPDPPRTPENPGSLPGLQAELTLIRKTIARHKQELGEMIGFGKDRHMARATNELGAAVDGMESATQQILKSVEIIDESARALTASLRDDYMRGLSQDIQDNVLRIYELCNFQDIAGQRIGKVMTTLAKIEQQVSGMLTTCEYIPVEKARSSRTLSTNSSLLNGPKLDGDAGHASQRDIDKIFG